MRWLRTILALLPCGKPQAAHFVHLVELLQWLPGRVNFTGLEHYGVRSARTHARWFGRPFPFARLAVASLGVLHPRVPKGLGSAVAVDASFVSNSGHGPRARAGFGAAWPAPCAGGHTAGLRGHRGGRRLPLTGICDFAVLPCRGTLCGHGWKSDAWSCSGRVAMSHTHPTCEGCHASVPVMVQDPSVAAHPSAAAAGTAGGQPGPVAAGHAAGRERLPGPGGGCAAGCATR